MKILLDTNVFISYLYKYSTARIQLPGFYHHS